MDWTSNVGWTGLGGAGPVSTHSPLVAVTAHSPCGPVSLSLSKSRMAEPRGQGPGLAAWGGRRAGMLGHRADL